jgi:hypothetical protein
MNESYIIYFSSKVIIITSSKNEILDLTLIEIIS